MGQFALGIRSLLVKATIFVIMAALLAWALGGTLFPRPETADYRSQAVQYDGSDWYWRLLVGGKVSGEVRWHLVQHKPDENAKVHSETPYEEVAGPVLGENGLYYIGRRPAHQGGWELVRLGRGGARQTWDLPDRLAAVQQLTRAQQGLPIQDAQTIASQRHMVLDPTLESADE